MPQAAGADAVAAAKACLEAVARRLQVDPKLVSSKLDAAAAAAWRRNKAEGRLGAVDCGRIQRARADPRRPSFLPVGVSKQRGRLGQSLSPFNLEVPEALLTFATANGVVDGKRLPRRPIELVWQAAKVMRKEIGADGLVTDAYLKRRAAIYEAGDVKRRYIKREDIGGTLLSWRARAPVDYVASRKYYCVAYTSAAAQTPSFQFLKELRESGFNLLLLGFWVTWRVYVAARQQQGCQQMSLLGRATLPPLHDPATGHPFFEGSEAEDLQLLSPEALAATFSDAYRDTRLQFGHERVLAAMLLGQSPWERYADPTGGLLTEGSASVSGDASKRSGA